MSHVDAGPLAGYNSLMDPHLSGYFTNTRMRQHLVKSGLITRRGNIVTENTYRLNMARKEHKKHVRDLLAQAIVHKTLDMERTRQVAIKQKLEEIAKIELVKRVKEGTSRRGDEDILPYLAPPKKKGSRPSSVPSGGSHRSSASSRPVSAPSKSKRSRSSDQSRGRRRLTVDDNGMPQSPRDRSRSNSRSNGSRPRSGRPYSSRPYSGRPQSGHSSASGSRQGSNRQGRPRTSKYPRGSIDDKHLYSMNSQSLKEYTMAQYNMDMVRGPSPYNQSQLPPDMVPVPPSSGSPRSARGRQRARPASSSNDRVSPRTSNKNSGQDRSTSRDRGSLMLHRQEPAMKHQERVQTLCDVNMHYFGASLSLDYERFDPRDEVMVEQQHCGGNTLIVFKERIMPGSDFTFVSRRHRGYPFSLTFYVNGVLNCRLSTCCEYKHQSGARLGGKQGHFGMVGIDGAAPCYKCQVANKGKGKKKKVPTATLR